MSADLTLTLACLAPVLLIGTIVLVVRDLPAFRRFIGEA